MRRYLKQMQYLHRIVYFPGDKPFLPVSHRKCSISSLVSANYSIADRLSSSILSGNML